VIECICDNFMIGIWRGRAP